LEGGRSEGKFFERRNLETVRERKVRDIAFDKIKAGREIRLGKEANSTFY